MSAKSLSPMMQQYFNLKEAHKDCLLFFRLGDFYELFFEDARIASKQLELTLTGRDCGLDERAPMCGVPFHSAENYIARLIEKGFKVAICEQMSDPALSKGLVERDVVRIVTPGTVTEGVLLREDANTYILSVYIDAAGYGYACADVSTGSFTVNQNSGKSALLDDIERIAPAELLYNASGDLEDIAAGLQRPPMLQAQDDGDYDLGKAKKLLLSHFNIPSLEACGCGNMPLAIRASGALLRYLQHTQKNALTHMRAINSERSEPFMVLSASARRNLELFETLGGEKRGSLLHLLKRTQTPMGARAMRQAMDKPLQDVERIQARLSAVEELKSDAVRLGEIRRLLNRVQDMERLISKAAYNTINARDAKALQKSMTVLPGLYSQLHGSQSGMLKLFAKEWDSLSDIEQELDKAIAESPPVSVREGDIIKDGYDAQVDKTRGAARGGAETIARLEQQEREETGIKNLKIGYNKVFGYYIEVTRSYLDKVPYRYVRKQTLAGAERFITEELKEMEETILGAREKCMRREYELFTGIRDLLLENTGRIQGQAHMLSHLDMLCALAIVAQELHYIRPEITQERTLTVRGGRHPVVEATHGRENFVPNHTQLDDEENRLLIITGPNMAGKSTYLRQVALITLMAHMGSFVPAEHAVIPLTDRIFTRIGASDDLSGGRSTFMVEMSEMAQILSQATPRSLLVLDEVGRGTSTFDGLSIAWAIIEHIADKVRLGAKTLFATHYHELTELEGLMDGVKNYRITIKELGEQIIFLHKIVRGGSDKSFGVQVARLAGIPDGIIKRAHDILKLLESADISHSELLKKAQGAQIEQLSLFAPPKENPALDKLRSLNINELAPLEALNILQQLQNMAREEA